MGFLDKLLKRTPPPASKPIQLPPELAEQLRLRAKQIYEDAMSEVRGTIRSVRETCTKLIKDNVELREQGEADRRAQREQTKQLELLQRTVASLARNQEASQIAISDLSRQVETATGKKPTAAVSAVVANAALAAIESAPNLATERRRGTGVTPQG